MQTLYETNCYKYTDVLAKLLCFVTGIDIDTGSYEPGFF